MPRRQSASGDVGMNNRRKNFTASQSKNTSRHLRTATLGTHMPRRSSGPSNAESMGFSSPRKQKRAARGFVDTILPTTTSRESSSQYSRRVSRREYTQDIQHRARMRRIIAAAVCLVFVVCIAGGVGIATFLGSLDSKLGLKNSDAAAALVTAGDASVFYAVVSADLDLAGSPGAVDGPDALALVRVDKNARKVSLVSIPPQVQTSLKDGKTHPIREAATLEGDASLVRAIASLADIDVSHFVKIDAAGIVSLVDSLGGIEVHVAEEVDDPAAGDVYLSPGTQVLTGQAALTFLRASNFTKGMDTQTANQRAFLTALSLRLLGEGTFDLASTVDKANGAFGTDVKATDAFSLADTLRGMEASSVLGALMPGYETTRDNVDYFVVSSDAWLAMMARMEAGETPETSDTPPTVDPSSFSLTVRNGAGITGAATQMTEMLTGLGFNVTEKGNTDVDVYNDTLVVYKDEASAAAAQTVVEALGVGRTVSGSSFYTFNTDVLLILGKDWKPTV